MGFQSQILGAMGSVAAAKKFADKKAAEEAAAAEKKAKEEAIAAEKAAKEKAAEEAKHITTADFEDKTYSIQKPYDFLNKTTRKLYDQPSYEPFSTFSEEKDKVANTNLQSNRLAKKTQSERYKNLLEQKKSMQSQISANREKLMKLGKNR